MSAASPEAGYLDAARACLVDVGWRRTTLTDIARRAGVSRMTIYRRWPDMEALVGDLLVREFSELLLEAGLLTGEGSALDQLADGVAAMCTALADNDLLRRIVELDPELLHPYLFRRLGRNQVWILELLERAIADGQHAGEIRDGRPETLARSVLLTSYGFVLSAPTATTEHTTGPALRAELRILIERYLRP